MGKFSLGRAALGVATMGQSETARAIMGKDSIYDPALDAVGLGIDEAGDRPDTSRYLDESKKTTADQLARAHALQQQGRDLANDAANFRTTQRVRDPGTITADRVTALQTNAPQLADAATVQERRLGAAREVTAPQLGEAYKVRAQQERGTDIARATDASGASAMLRSAALGEAPSKAEAQLRAGADRIAGQQQSAAAAARGSERRGARRAAMLAVGEQGAALNNQLAAVRADEMARGRGEYAQFSQNAQQLEQSTNTQQAQLAAATAARNAAMAGRADEVNAAALNARDLERAGYVSRAGELNAAAGNLRDVQQGTMGARADEVNAAAINSRASERAGYDYNTAQANAGRGMQAQGANATNNLNAATNTAQLGMQSDSANAGIQQTDQQIRQSGRSAGLGVQTNALNLGNQSAADQLRIASGEAAAAQAAWEAARQREQIQRDARTQLALKGAGYVAGGPIGANIASGWGSQGGTGGALNPYLSKQTQPGKRPEDYD